MNVSRAFFVVLLLASITASGCAWNRKGRGSRIVEGDGGNITYTDRESAGGRIGGR